MKQLIALIATVFVTSTFACEPGMPSASAHKAEAKKEDPKKDVKKEEKKEPAKK